LSDISPPINLSPINLSPLPPGYRGAGLLLHVTSLPTPYGIGDVGPAALAWVDRLHESDQSWWQALPLGPTGYGDSPYQSLSSFAGNGLLISPDSLVVDGLLLPGDLPRHQFPDNAVDYETATPFKHRMLETVGSNFNARAGRDLKLAYEKFCNEQSHWLEDYALFRALKARHNGSCYLEWPAELVRREAVALAKARQELAREIDLVRLAQFLLNRQGERLKEYAHARNVRLIGDLPFFVSPDSSDVWANPELFLLDERRRPRFVGGVPPDYFSAQGQLWGNPVYDWKALRRIGYRWCIDRVRALLAHVDLIRLDHFRGFAAAWQIPAEAPTAQSGQWVAGPGAEFFRAVLKDLGALPFIAEDLGVITPEVQALRDQFNVPGTRVLQFAFDGNPNNPYLPDNYVPNSVVYTGTHDNNTARGWYEGLPDNQRQNLCRYVKRPTVAGGEVATALLRLAWSSAAALALAPLQDLLNISSEARMNVPGVASGNWRWRCTKEMLAGPDFQWLRDLTNSTNRSTSGQSDPFSQQPVEVTA
jgi:4-alpha-glucanotransferase